MNEGGSITDEVDLILSYKGHKERATFAVCNLGKVLVIIEHRWLKHHNPEVDWEMGSVEMTRCPRSCGKEFCIKRKEKVRMQLPNPEYVNEWEGFDEEAVYATWYDPWKDWEMFPKQLGV